MEKMSLRELAVPIIKSIDSFNYLLKSHHRHTAIISWHIGKKMGLSNEDLFELVVAAAIHDIGALSVQERDLLVREDVINPQPHCIMGHHMLKPFEAFRQIAQIIKHHHIKYQDFLNMADGEVMFQSHIIHLADRVDILINPEEFILNQKKRVLEKIKEKVETDFHPDVYAAFDEVSLSDIFWLEINDLSIDDLFDRIDANVDFKLTIDNIMDFSLSLSRIIDYRSRFTASHSYTVAYLAKQLGKYFGFSDEDCQKLQVSGYLHDIGKIGVDPGLIEKNGPLSDDEFNHVKLHAYYTGQILKNLSRSEWFKDIVLWSQNHHEKNNGHGYPQGLDDSVLDTGAKIVAFSDVISALMENRPYRDSLPVDVAFNIIKEKIAPSISLSMFADIEQHKDEINDLVVTCHQHSFEEYELEDMLN